MTGLYVFAFQMNAVTRRQPRNGSQKNSPQRSLIWPQVLPGERA